MLHLDTWRAMLTDGRFLANLVAGYTLVMAVVGLSVVGRRLLTRGGVRLGENEALGKLGALGRDAAVRVERVLARLTLAAILAMTTADLGYHVLGRDVRADLARLYHGLAADDWVVLGVRTAAVLAALAGAGGLMVLVRRARPSLEQSALAQLGAAESSDAVRRWFGTLERYAHIAVALGGLALACRAAGVGAWANVSLGFVLRVLSIVAVARLVTLAGGALARLAGMIGDARLGAGPYQHYWERMKVLFPFGRRCFEAAVYVEAGALIVGELAVVAPLADYGPALVRCIGIFFVTRVLIEVAFVLLNQTLGRPAEDDVAADKKRQTLVPLLHSVCQYTLYFGSAVLMLTTLGVNTTPILAGASIIGLAVGLGAQSLVTDLVSGFFILFEGQYLVGDQVQIGDAVGRVEEVAIRLTRIRDARGRLYIIPNGQIKNVVNYSKDYVNAVVDLKVPAGADVEGLFRALAEAGRRLREAAPREVLADTRVEGLVELGPADMTVRAVTRVRPGRHEKMQNEFRRLLKKVLDESKEERRDEVPAPPPAGVRLDSSAPEPEREAVPTEDVEGSSEERPDIDEPERQAA